MHEEYNKIIDERNYNVRNIVNKEAKMTGYGNRKVIVDGK